MINDNPSVSVVVATHNHAHFLPESLGSIKAQSYGNYELIVVDNGSTDNTKEIIQQLTWDKLKYYYQNNTGSVAGPRNTGIRLAKGRYVAFLDSDDLWYSEKLEKTMALLEKDQSIDIICHDMWLTRKGRENLLLKTGPLKKDMFKALLTLNSFLGSATVVKRDVLIEIGGFDERKEFVHAEDYETWLKAAYIGRKFAFINEPLGEYRVHDSNLSHDFERALLNEINVINKHFGNFKSKMPFYKTFLRSIPVSRIFLTMGVRYFSQKKYVLGSFNILKSFFINPLSLLNFLFSSFNNVLLKSINKSSL